MRSKFLFPALVILAMALSCNRNAVSLSYTNAKEEVPQLGNLVFRFNQSLASDSMLNAWDSTEYITFEPQIPGRFRWESPDQLVFSPSQPLAPATTYKATVRNAVLRFSVKDGDDIHFHTPALALDNPQVIWMQQDEDGRTAVPQVDLLFNYPVKPEDLKDKLTIEIGGNKTSFVPVTVSPDNKISIRLNAIRLEDKDLDATIHIAKGLKPQGGNNATEEPIKASFSIPSPYVLTIQSITSEHDGVEGLVRVTTSQQLSSESLKPFIKINPELAYTTQLSDNGFIIRSDKFDVEKSYTLTLVKGLRGKIGGTLREDYDGSIAFGELEAGISFTNNKGVYLSKRGGKNIEVQVTNVAKVKLVISRIYENNLLMAQRYGYYPEESGNRGYDGEYEGDYYDGGGEGMLGDVIYEKEIDTRSLPRSGAGRLLNFSQFEDRLPDFKGIYHVMIRSTEDYWVRDSRFISLSDLGLIAKEGQDKMYVFTNSIKTAAPAEGVNVTVYAMNNQLIGAGTTNSDGVAEIPYTKKEFKGFRPAMVVVKTADDFNYLPFNTTRVNTSRFDVGGKRNNPTGLDAFVYAERDIYRPGEKVNFSVIVRDRQWKSPGEIPLKLKFLLPNGKELRALRKSLNDQGALEADVDLIEPTGFGIIMHVTVHNIPLKIFTLDRGMLNPGPKVRVDLPLERLHLFGSNGNRVD